MVVLVMCPLNGMKQQNFLTKKFHCTTVDIEFGRESETCDAQLID